MPGDYLVVSDEAQEASVSHPFPTTFSPNASRIEDDPEFHLSAVQQVLNADVYLPQPVSTRPVRVVLEWNGHNRYQYSAPGIHPAPAVRSFTARQLAEDTYEIDLLTNHT